MLHAWLLCWLGLHSRCDAFACVRAHREVGCRGTAGDGAIDSGEKLAGDTEEAPIDHGLTNKRYKKNERTITSSPRRFPMAHSGQGWLAA
jgi:hypothetical protein